MRDVRCASSPGLRPALPNGGSFSPLPVRNGLSLTAEGHTDLDVNLGLIYFDLIAWCFKPDSRIFHLYDLEHHYSRRIIRRLLEDPSSERCGNSIIVIRDYIF